MATLIVNAMHPPTIPRNTLSERPDPRAPIEGCSLLSPVVVSVDSVVVGLAAEQN